MSLTIDHDILESTGYGYAYSQGEAVTVASGILVSSTENTGVFSNYAGSSLINNGYIISTSFEDNGVGLEFAQNDASLLNAAGASITGMTMGMRFDRNRLTLANYGTIKGLHGDAGDPGFGIVCVDTGSAGVGMINIFNGVGGLIAGGHAAIAVEGITAGRILIDNRGTLDGVVYMYGCSTNDLVINRGTIRGDVYLDAGDDVFKSIGGRAGAVDGGDGHDTLVGGSRADWFAGGIGNDFLSGGAGRDKFVFNSSLELGRNVDKIADFKVNIDAIVLDNAGLMVGPVGTLTAARFHIGPHAADASDRIIYNPDTGALYYDHDGRGGDAQVQFAKLAAHLPLDHEDLIVITGAG